MAFKSFHKGGFITAVELREIFESLGEKISDKEVRQLLKTAEAKEGRVNYKQFSTMMKNILESADADKAK